MFNRLLAALVAAPLFLAACEDETDTQIDPNCEVDCEVEDTEPEETITVPFTARTTISGTAEPCKVRYESRDSPHTVTDSSGTIVQLNAGETYDLFVGTPSGLHERESDGVLFTSRPTVAEPVSSSAAAPQTASLELDPYFAGNTVRCEITHTPSGSFDSWATSNEGTGVETAWMEWSYDPENEWEDPIQVAANCLDFGNHGLYCFVGKSSIDHYSHSGNFIDTSNGESIMLTPNSFSYSTSDDWYDISCQVY